MEPHLREVLDQSRAARARASSFFALRNARLKLGIARGVTIRALEDTLRRFVTATPTPRSPCTTIARASCARPYAAAISSSCSCRSGSRSGRSALLPAGRGPAVRDPAGGARVSPPWSSCRWRTLAEQALVCGDGCPFWEAADRAFREQGLVVTPKAIATRAEWLFELVSAGVGVGVCAHHADLPRGLVSRPIDGTGAGARDQSHHQARAALFPPGQGVRRSGAEAAAARSGGGCRGLSQFRDGGDDDLPGRPVATSPHRRTCSGSHHPCRRRRWPESATPSRRPGRGRRWSGRSGPPARA